MSGEKYAEAEPLLKRALDMNEAMFGADSPNFVSSLNDLGLLYELQEKYPEAESFYNK